MKLVCKFTIDHSFTDLNAYIDQCRANKYAANQSKQYDTFMACMACRDLPALENFPVYITCIWHVPNKKKDPDNIVFAKKFILDGMVGAGLLPDDSMKYIAGFKDIIEHGGNYVEVFVEEKTV